MAGASLDEPRTDSEEIFVLQRIPGGNYLSVMENVSSTVVFAGNPVILRDDYLSTRARMSFIDITQQLPAGLLREFLFYTHNFADDDMVPDRFEMRAQIWKQIEPSTEDDKYRYTLVWEHRVTGTVASESGILWRVSGLSFFAHMWLNGKLHLALKIFKFQTILQYRGSIFFI